MSPPVVLNIEFENKIGYLPGSNVNGQVEIILKKKLPIKAITVYAKGKSEVNFKKFVFPGQFISVSDDEEFYTKVLPIFGRSLGSSSHNFTKGTYRYSFSFDIPEDVPHSFESKYGYVRHFCKAVVEIDNSNFENVEFPILFNVLPLLDLNVEQSAKWKIEYSGEKNVWYLCGKAGFISMILNIEKSGFSPSENIVINAECTNGSSRPSVTKAELFQIITYRGNGKEMTKKKLITSKCHPEIGPGNDDVWSNENILVPQLPPSELRGSTLIHIHYKIKVRVVPTGLANSLKASFPIMIGTIPLLPQDSSSHEANTSSLPSNPYFADSAPTAPPMTHPQESKAQVINISVTSSEDTNVASSSKSISIKY
ncbi:UNVERIFIED_CONTAM: hypothetical protein RMT77_018843 [Armadillidium vulgare]